MKCIVLDIETTGMSRYYHKITEIAAVKVENNTVIDKFHTLINPQTHIPSFITKLTGIDDYMVKDAPVIEEVLPKLKDFLGEHTIVAHNATFDYGFLSHNFKMHINHELTNKAICTLRLANRIPIDFENRKLGTLCNYFNIKNEREHRAMGDTMATVQLLNEFTQILHKNNIKDIEDIHTFCFTPPQKCKDKIKL
jgi:DNA polymerase III subunit alpha, Gram-positive type